MEHGRIVGANMAGQPLAYRGSLLMNIVEVADLEIASFGAWESTTAEVLSALKPERPAYRKLLWQDDRIIGAMHPRGRNRTSGPRMTWVCSRVWCNRAYAWATWKELPAATISLTSRRPLSPPAPRLGCCRRQVLARPSIPAGACLGL